MIKAKKSIKKSALSKIKIKKIRFIQIYII